MPTPTDCSQLLQYLTELGYSSEHAFVQALRRNEAIDLNIPDENGLTPLRIAIQQRKEDVIRGLYRLEPHPKYLSLYDRAMINEVVHHDKRFFKRLSVANHREIIRCIQALYSLDPRDMDDGVCLGIAQMRRRAFFAGEADIFRKRLKNIKYNLWSLIEKAMGEVEKQGVDLNKDLVSFFRHVREKLQGQFPYHIWHDLYAFLDGVILYANSTHFPELFEQGAFLGQQVLAAERLLPSEGKGVQSQYVFSGCYTKATLPIYFTCLDKAFKPLPHPISFSIYTGNHIFIVDYFQGNWVFTDANHLELGENEYNNDGIATILLKSYSEPLIFATVPFPANITDSFNQSITALKEDPAWVSLPIVNKEQTIKKDMYEYDLLYVAAKQGDTETVKQCVHAGAENLPQGKNKLTPLYAAAYNGHINVVKELIKALKDDKEKINQAVTDGATPLYAAASNGHIDIVIELIKALKDDKEKINQATTDGCTPLYVAAAKGHIDIVRELIKALRDDKEKINQATTDGCTPLYVAAAKGHIDIVIELIKALKDDKEKINQATTDGCTPLYVAAAKGHIDIVRELIKALKDDKEKINQATTKGYTPLCVAVQCGFTTIVEELLNHGANLTTPIEESTQKLLDVAKKQHCEDKLRQLFAEEKIKDSFLGFTPLHAAIAFGHGDIVQLLGKSGATFTQSTSGISAYKLAVAMNRVEILPAKLQQLKKAMDLVKSHIQSYLQNKAGSPDKEIECYLQYLTNENHFMDSGVEGLFLTIAESSQEYTEIAFRNTLSRMTLELESMRPHHDAALDRQKNWFVFALNLLMGALAVGDASGMKAAWSVTLGIISVGVALGTKILHTKWASGNLTFFATRGKLTNSDDLDKKAQENSLSTANH